MEKVFKNAAWLLFGQIAGRTLRAGILIYAARILGASSWGAFSYALSAAAAFTVFSDIGINSLLVREGSRDAEKRKDYLSAGLVLKSFLIAIIAIVISLFGDLLAKMPEAAVLMPLVAFIFIFDALRDFVSALARSADRMDIDAKGQIVTNAGIVIAGGIMLSMEPTSRNLILGYVFGTAIGFLYVVSHFLPDFKGILKRFRMDRLKEVVTLAWPFGLVGLMSVIMINTDILVLGWFGSASDVGLFSSAQKPIQLLYLIPSMLTAAFFPELVRVVNDKEAFKRTLMSGLRSSLFFALPIAFGGFIAARPVMNLLYGAEYISASASFGILALACIFVFPSLFVTNAIFALGKQKFFLLFVLIGIFGNIILDIALIPRFGITGCAMATAAIQGLLLFYALPKLGLSIDIFKGSNKFVAAALMMAVTIAPLVAMNINGALIVLIGGAVYFAMLVVLKDPTLGQIIGKLKKKPVSSGVEV